MPFGDEYILLLPIKYRQNEFLRRIARVLFVFTLLLCILFISSFYVHQKQMRPPPMKRISCPVEQYDYDLLAFRWTPTLCLKKECVSNVERWQIHGLWPTFFNGSWPSFCCKDSDHDKKRKYCCKDLVFNPKKIKTILIPLEEKWANQIPGQADDSLWIHEWNKHGTCSRVGRNEGVFGYFNSTMNLFNKYAIQEWLNQAGIVPTSVSSQSTYDLVRVKEVIESQVGHKIKIKCEPNDKSSSLLDTLYMCLNPTSFELIDCPGADECKNKVVLPKAKS